jgi:hypothetical protein
VPGVRVLGEVPEERAVERLARAGDALHLRPDVGLEPRVRSHCCLRHRGTECWRFRCKADDIHTHCAVVQSDDATEPYADRSRSLMTLVTAASETFLATGHTIILTENDRSGSKRTV